MNRRFRLGRRRSQESRRGSPKRRTLSGGAPRPATAQQHSEYTVQDEAAPVPGPASLNSVAHHHATGLQLTEEVVRAMALSPLTALMESTNSQGWIRCPPACDLDARGEELTGSS